MSLADIITSRKSVHGEYSQTAVKAQEIKRAMLETAGETITLTHIQRESLEMIATKLARICCGDPDYRDHWDDIAGYATLVLERLKEAPTK